PTIKMFCNALLFINMDKSWLVSGQKYAITYKRGNGSEIQSSLTNITNQGRSYATLVILSAAKNLHHVRREILRCAQNDRRDRRILKTYW
ncbi:MAG: hypothetical protein ACRDIV_24085, partial [Ktedonobacteraceae bacterium]